MADRSKNSTDRSSIKEGYIRRGGINRDPKSQIKKRPAPPKPIQTRPGFSPGKQTKNN